MAKPPNTLPSLSAAMPSGIPGLESICGMKAVNLPSDVEVPTSYIRLWAVRASISAVGTNWTGVHARRRRCVLAGIRLYSRLGLGTWVDLRTEWLVGGTVADQMVQDAQLARLTMTDGDGCFSRIEAGKGWSHCSR